ncbi:hypothetical protein [Microbacterium sp. B35-30]|uniref:hypothetical protein n=1 Tax=Microbacterium sp. B35-30 TaxID=1962642 RepID=UPI0013D5F16D|nr:hypothetical protein [Microbacterium sp. B35-30]KAF2415690.1 hypothetical protein B2K11_18820 [Microbacterium sp. B35-30]
MTFLRWLVPTPYPYVSLGIPLIVLVMGYGWLNVVVALTMSLGIFLSAGWVDYRRHARGNPSPSGTSASPAHVVDALHIADPLTPGGPRFAEFDRRIPTRAEADRILSEGLGLALRRVPREHSELEFLQWFPHLRGLWIYGPVHAARIGDLTALSHLSLIAAGGDDIDLSKLRGLTFYEGELRGRESVTALPAVRELYLGEVDAGRLERVPPELKSLALHGATGLTALDVVGAAPGLRELDVQGPRHLDIAALSDLKHLRNVSLADIGRLTGCAALSSLAALRELRLDNVEDVDDPGALRSLRGVEVVMTGLGPRV